MRRYLLLVVLLACDSRAKASDPSGGGGQKSKEYETCGTTAHCDGDLRCFDHVCRRPNRSTVGDYFAAVGANLRAKGDLDGAVSAYNQATGNYDSEKVATPPDLDCAYGSALAAARGKKENGELGAKLLHRCLLAVPGGALRERALADLATLNDAGLDPLTLGRTAPADVYLKLAAAPPPSTDKTVTVEAKPAAAGVQPIVDKLMGADLHNAFVACAAKAAVNVSLPIKNVYYASQYDDEPGGFALKLDPAKAGASPDETCVRAIVEPALKGINPSAAFSTNLAISVK